MITRVILWCENTNICHTITQTTVYIKKLHKRTYITLCIAACKQYNQGPRPTHCINSSYLHTPNLEIFSAILHSDQLYHVMIMCVQYILFNTSAIIHISLEGKYGP